MAFGKNKGKVNRTLDSSFDPKKHLPFIGIVRYVITKDSEQLTESQNVDPEISQYVDNRLTILVTPIDTEYNTYTIECRVMNNHDFDVPVPREAVLCLPTLYGYVIVDRFSPELYKINLDNKEYLLSVAASNENDVPDTQILPENADVIKEGVQSRPPIFPKVGGKYWLGRNGQYIIADAKRRLEVDDENDGKYLKIGFYGVGEEFDTSEDSQIILSRDQRIDFLFSEDVNAENFDPEQFTEDEGALGIGMQSNDIYFIGRNYVVLHSQDNFLLSAVNNFFLEAGNEMTILAKNSLNIKSNDKFVLEAVNQLDVLSRVINLGGEQNKQPVVKGEVLFNTINTLLDIIISMNGKIITPAGNGAFTPDITARLTSIKSSIFGNKNATPILSRKVFTT